MDVHMQEMCYVLHIRLFKLILSPYNSVLLKTAVGSHNICNKDLHLHKEPTNGC